MKMAITVRVVVGAETSSSTGMDALDAMRKDAEDIGKAVEKIKAAFKDFKDVSIDVSPTRAQAGAGKRSRSTGAKRGPKPASAPLEPTAGATR